ncbi:hypothetical protein GPROT1_00060, partial [Gammaproteobacteria bacterium]
YDPANQGGVQYGNQTEQIEYDANLLPYRRTRSAYYPNTAQWIVAKPGYTNVDSWNGSAWVLANSTWYSYDGHPGFSTPPGTLGQLTAMRAWNGVIPAQLIDTIYTYDAWGNRRTETTYDGYGTGTAFASSNPKTTTTAYDDAYHLYPIATTNAKGQAAQSQFYGINGVPTDGNPIGLLKKTIDPNGAETTYTYDTFGRLLKVIRPGDTEAAPTTRYEYRTGSKFEIGTYDKEDAAGNTHHWSREVYDGLGRLIQGQSEKDNNQATVVNTQYDARGLVVQQTTPVELTSTPSGLNYLTPNWSGPRTQTTYDALGRVFTLISPDGTRTERRYELASDNGQMLVMDNLIDANRHRKQYRYDVFGRLVKALELTGDCSQYGTWGFTCVAPYTTQWSTYATTQYTYDVLANLKTVQDAAGNQTSMNYDVLGRKTSMTDPDMGYWTYTYDNAGNLITQTDARNQTLWFRYDELNRLLEKRRDNSGGAVLASYVYDQGSNAIGQRTSMTDPSGGTSWAYDTRGRMIGERKSIGAPQMLEAEGPGMGHLVGAAQGGAWVSPASGSGYLTYGPYQAPTAIGPDQVASFRLAIDTASGANDAIARVEVYDYTAYQQIAMRTVYRREFVGGLSNFSDFALTFDTTGRSGHALEYRVYWFGSAILAHDKTLLYWGPYTTGYAYDAMDRVTAITYPTGEVVQQTYNNATQLSSLSGTNPYVSGLTYNALGQIRQMNLGNGDSTSYAYYGDGGGAPAINSFRLWQVQTSKSGSPLMNLQYTYDNVGNVMSIADTVISQTQSFQYDSLDRLLHAQATGGSSGTYNEDYTYNPIGNFLSKGGVSYTLYDPSHKHAVQRVNGTGGVTRTVTVRASGSYGNGWPIMKLYVNGQERAQWTVSSSSYGDYVINTPLTGNDQIDVAFVNDAYYGAGQDRNLYVDYVVVDGTVVQVEGATVALDWGTGSTAFDWQGVGAGQESLFWDGALRFVVGAKAWAGGYDANGNMTARLESNGAYLQTWDVENRLVTVTVGS